MSEQAGPGQLVIFTLAGEQYALPITRVQEIIRYTQPRSVASADVWVRGVLSLRGKIVPVCDLAARLGVSSEPGEHTKIVILESSSQIVGVIVDAVEEVRTVDQAHIESAPGADTTLIDSIAKLDERLIVLLNPSAVFDSIVGPSCAEIAPI